MFVHSAYKSKSTLPHDHDKMFNSPPTQLVVHMVKIYLLISSMFTYKIAYIKLWFEKLSPPPPQF